MSDIVLTTRSVIVTGAGRGIGRAHGFGPVSPKMAQSGCGTIWVASTSRVKLQQRRCR